MRAVGLQLSKFPLSKDDSSYKENADNYEMSTGRNIIKLESHQEKKEKRHVIYILKNDRIIIQMWLRDDVVL